MYDNNDLEEEGRYNWKPYEEPAAQNSYQAVQWGQMNPPHNTEGGWQTPEGFIPANSGNQAGYQDTSYWASRGTSPDDIFDANGQMNPGWARTGQGYSKTGAPPTTGGGPTTPGPGGPNPPAFQPPQSGSYSPSGTGHFPTSGGGPSIKTPAITDEVTRILMARLGELQNPGDVQNDPIYQNAVRANQIGLLRSGDRQRKALAERSAAGGTRATGGFNVGVRGIEEQVGEQDANYRSGLALDRLRDRETQLVEAIKIARAMGNDDMANQLELQRLELQQELGRGDLSLRGELGRGQLDLGYGNLGLGYADLIQRMNRDAIIYGLDR